MKIQALLAKLSTDGNLLNNDMRKNLKSYSTVYKTLYILKPTQRNNCQKNNPVCSTYELLKLNNTETSLIIPVQ